jgi:hypothetical protein
LFSSYHIFLLRKAAYLFQEIPLKGRMFFRNSFDDSGFFPHFKGLGLVF